MIGLGIAIGTIALRRAGAAAAPSPAPTPAPPPSPTPTPTPASTTAYLPPLTTAGASYHSVYSAERLLPSHAGGLLLASDGDLGTGASGVAPSAIASRRGTAEALRVRGWRDQSGNGRDALAGPAAEYPAVREDVTIGGALALAFDGRRAGDGRGPQTRRIVASTALDAGDCTIAYVIDPTVSVQQQYYFELLRAATPTTAIGHLQYPGSQFSGALPDVHGNIAINGSGIFGRNGGRKIATVPQVIVLRCGGATLDLFIDGAAVASLAPTSGATAALSIGMASYTDGLESYIPTFRLGAFVTIARAVNDADVAAISSALMTRFGIPTDYDAVVVNIGSSRVAGTSQSVATRTKAWFERAHYGTRRIRSYNLAADGKSLSAARADRAVFDAEVYDSARPTVYVIDDPINDLGGLGASSDPSAIYATLSSYASELKALGSRARVVLATCLPQKVGYYPRSDAEIEAGRGSLNAMIRANGAGAHAVSDPAASPTMGAYPHSGDPATYPDRLHPSSAGYAQLASYNPAATIAALSA